MPLEPAAHGVSVILTKEGISDTGWDELQTGVWRCDKRPLNQGAKTTR